MALGCSWHLGPFGIMVMKGHMSKPLLFDSAKCNCPAGGPWCTYLTSGRRRKDRLWSLQRQVERETLRACQRPHISTSTLTLRVYFSNPMDDWSVSLLPGGQTGRSPYLNKHPYDSCLHGPVKKRNKHSNVGSCYTRNLWRFARHC